MAAAGVGLPAARAHRRMRVTDLFLLKFLTARVWRWARWAYGQARNACAFWAVYARGGGDLVLTCGGVTAFLPAFVVGVDGLRFSTVRLQTSRAQRTVYRHDDAKLQHSLLLPAFNSFSGDTSAPLLKLCALTLPSAPGACSPILTYRATILNLLTHLTLTTLGDVYSTG